MKIWQRYLFSRLTCRLLFLLLTLLSLYILVDLSVNGVRFFNQQQATVTATLFYYLSRFGVHLDLFFPFSFLLASLWLLVELNTHRELIALQVGGLSKKRLLLPFFFVSFLLSLISYGNAEWFYTRAQRQIAFFERFHPLSKESPPPLYFLTLPDASQVVYRTFDENSRTFFDLFWIRSFEEIWHIEALSCTTVPPTGHAIDQFIQNQGELEKRGSLATRPFPELPLETERGRDSPTRLSHRPLSELFHLAPLLAPKKAPLFTHLFNKLTRPLLPPLLLLWIAPFTLSYQRTFRPFALFACALVGLLTTYTLLDGMVILGENALLPPWLAIFGPFAFLLAPPLWLFLKKS